ncbi:MAG TPA: adenosine deaminase [Acidimicrobiia bacterium]|jgi:adenosine deaminase
MVSLDGRAAVHDPHVRDLRVLPKAHLHVHTEGAMRPATLAELAGAAGIAVPEVRGFGSFTMFAGMYLAACDVLTTYAALARLVEEVVADAAADGAVWVEPAIHLPHHAERLGPPRETLEVVLDAASRGAAAHGIGAGVIVSADRTKDPAVALADARLAAEFAGRGVVGFGLANDEAGHPPEPFAAAFAIAREAGLLSVPHAGELEGPASIVGALDALGANRIQHGVRAVEQPALVRRLADSAVCLDVCPTSNVLLGVVAAIADHPLPALLDAGVRCSLNADDPLLFGPNLLDEYELARAALGLDDAALGFIARCSIEHSGAGDDVKQKAFAGIGAWLES